MISIKLDGVKKEIAADSILRDVLEGTDYVGDTTVGIIKSTKEQTIATNEYRIQTTAGEIGIELEDSDVADIWKSANALFADAGTRWVDGNTVTFGPIPLSITPSRKDFEYTKWDVLFGAEGYDAEKGYLILVKKSHFASHGSPDSGGIFAKIVGGRGNLDRLTKSDTILGIEPVVKFGTSADSFTTTDLKTPIEDGMELFTHVNIELSEHAPYGSEHALSAITKDIVTVDSTSSSFISYDRFVGEEVPFENFGSRYEGTVTVRHKGGGKGRIYISKTDRSSTPSHSVIGHVTKGVELVKIAKMSDKLAVNITPKRVMLMGKGFAEAEVATVDLGLKIHKEGYIGDDAIIIDQAPDNTMDILKKGEIWAVGLHPDHLIDVELYDDLAPKSLDFFRHVTGLLTRPVGPLSAYMAYENTLLLKALKDAPHKELMPENIPKDVAKAGEIGLTNQAANRAETLGVKFVDDKRYGPSGEKFECTNLIGRVTNLDKLVYIKEGEKIYLMEVKK